jgi:hypothetical protein
MREVLNNSILFEMLGQDFEKFSLLWSKMGRGKRRFRLALSVVKINIVFSSVKKIIDKNCIFVLLSPRCNMPSQMDEMIWTKFKRKHLTILYVPDTMER